VATGEVVIALSNTLCPTPSLTAPVPHTLHFLQLISSPHPTKAPHPTKPLNTHACITHTMLHLPAKIPCHTLTQSCIHTVSCMYNIRMSGRIIVNETEKNINNINMEKNEGMESCAGISRGLLILTHTNKEGEGEQGGQGGCGGLGVEGESSLGAPETLKSIPTMLPTEQTNTATISLSVRQSSRHLIARHRICRVQHEAPPTPHLRAPPSVPSPQALWYLPDLP
jgi:hypothetical protein